jgi:hypothetical protein
MKRQQRRLAKCGRTLIRSATCAGLPPALLSCSPWWSRKRPVSARFRRCALAVHIGLLRMLEDLRRGRNVTGARRSGIGGRSTSKPGARAAFATQILPRTSPLQGDICALAERAPGRRKAAYGQGVGARAEGQKASSEPVDRRAQLTLPRHFGRCTSRRGDGAE